MSLSLRTHGHRHAPLPALPGLCKALNALLPMPSTRFFPKGLLARLLFYWHFFICLLFLLFLEQFYIQEKLRFRKVPRLPTHPAHSPAPAPRPRCPPAEGTEATAHLRSHSWRCPLHGFEQMHNDASTITLSLSASPSSFFPFFLNFLVPCSKLYPAPSPQSGETPGPFRLMLWNLPSLLSLHWP